MAPSPRRARPSFSCVTTLQMNIGDSHTSSAMPMPKRDEYEQQVCDHRERANSAVGERSHCLLDTSECVVWMEMKEKTCIQSLASVEIQVDKDVLLPYTIGHASYGGLCKAPSCHLIYYDERYKNQWTDTDGMWMQENNKWGTLSMSLWSCYMHRQNSRRLGHHPCHWPLKSSRHTAISMK